MAIFSNHKIGIAEILREIPEEELTKLSITTKVDYCSKVLYGKLMFYLLLYGMLRIDRLSQRGLRDAFSSPFFRTLFNFETPKGISHSSISDRLDVINVDFFRGAYDCIYSRFSRLYTEKEIHGLNLQRVDSTLVKESGNKLREGLTCGNKHSKSKMLKYTLNFDGMFASCANVYKEEKYASECNALPENVLGHFKKSKDHATVYVFDRGQASSEAFKEMNSEKELLFVGRLKEKRKLKEIESFDVNNVEFSSGELESDGLYKLYKYVNKPGKNGKEIHTSEPTNQLYRIIRFKPEGKNESIVLITNMMELTAEEIAKMYHRRWDIEVFFRFLKQELNFSHFLSLSENGIQVILYMTLITAMLVMIYKKENDLGYKTAVRRMMIELESLIMAVVVIQSGGDLRKTQLPDP